MSRLTGLLLGRGAGTIALLMAAALAHGDDCSHAAPTHAI